MANTESAAYIAHLDEDRPTSDKSLGITDDHLRLIKKTIVDTFVGGENDGYDTELKVGPRYLNDLPGRLNLTNYVTLDKEQTITGGKVFSGGLAADEIFDEAVEPMLTAKADGYEVGNTTKPAAFVVPTGEQAYVRAGPSGTPAAILTTANLATLAVNILHPVGSVLLTMTGSNPATRWPGTTWQQRAKGRAIFGVGTSTDVNGESYTVSNARDQHGYAGHYLEGEQIPQHTHEIEDVDRAQTGDSDTWADAIRANGSANPGPLETDGGSVIPGAKASEPVITVPPWEGVYVWERVG